MKEKLRGSGRPTRCLSPAFPGLSFESDLFPSFTSVCLPAKSLQSCPAFWDPRDWSPPGFSVYGILQARILEWVAMLFFRESSWPKPASSWIKPTSLMSPAMVGRFLITSATWEATPAYGRYVLIYCCYYRYLIHSSGKYIPVHFYHNNGQSKFCTRIFIK